MRITLTLIVLLISLTSFSQESSLFNKPIGLNLSTSTSYSFFDNKTSEYVNNTWTWEYLDFGIHYSKFFIYAEFSQSGLESKKTLKISNQELNNANELKMKRVRFKLGGTFFINSKYALEPYGGLNLNKYKEKNTNIDQMVNGYNIGLNIVRQIQIKPSYTIGLFIGSSLNTSGLTNLNSDYGNYYYSLSLGLKYLNLSFMK
jgi:hypothetical protein